MNKQSGKRPTGPVAGSGPQGAPMPINFSETSPVVCDKYGNEDFTQIFKIRKISALLSPNGMEGQLPVALFSCTKCGHVNEDFLPKGS